MTEDTKMQPVPQRLYTRNDFLYFAGMIADMAGKADDQAFMDKAYYACNNFFDAHNKGLKMFETLNRIKSKEDKVREQTQIEMLIQEIDHLKMRIEVQNVDFHRKIAQQERYTTTTGSSTAMSPPKYPL